MAARLTRRAVVAYFVSPSLHFAGIERVVHEVASGLADTYGDELDVHVIYSSPYDEEVLDAPSYTLHVLGADRLRSLPGAVRRVVRGIRPDVLVVPQVEAAVTVWAATRGLPQHAFVTHLHGNPEVEESGGGLRTRVAFALFRSVVRHRSAAVFAVSQGLARAVSAGLGDGVRVVFVPNPVRGFAGAVADPVDDGTLKLLCVARLSLQKGQDVLLDALALARSALPPVSLALVGQTGEGDLDRLTAQRERLGLHDVVTFPGYSSDPLEHLLGADVFVLPSRWEGFGVALVEALDVGLPVLTTDADFGPSDVVTHEDIGEVVAAGDPAALAEGLVRVAGRLEELRRPEAVAARRAVAQEFSSQRATAAHRAALRDVLEAPWVTVRASS